MAQANWRPTAPVRRRRVPRFLPRRLLPLARKIFRPRQARPQPGRRYRHRPDGSRRLRAQGRVDCTRRRLQVTAQTLPLRANRGRLNDARAEAADQPLVPSGRDCFSRRLTENAAAETAPVTGMPRTGPGESTPIPKNQNIPSNSSSRVRLTRTRAAFQSASSCRTAGQRRECVIFTRTGQTFTDSGQPQSITAPAISNPVPASS
jgi:hypothetical protein